MEFILIVTGWQETLGEDGYPNGSQKNETNFGFLNMDELLAFIALHSKYSVEHCEYKIERF